MKNFKVTSEILELFRNENVSAKTVKKLIPNYMEYQIRKAELCSSKFLTPVSDKLAHFICGTHYLTAQEFLDRIQSILEFEGLLRKDNTQEIFCFDGTGLDEHYGYYEISETTEHDYIEPEAALLERICKEIRQAKKKEKEEQLQELQNIKITNEMLTKIANDPGLMQQLLTMKGY